MQIYTSVSYTHLDVYKRQPQARTAWLREPYCGAEENYRGYPRMSNEELAGYVDRALDENMQDVYKRQVCEKGTRGFIKCQW